MWATEVVCCSGGGSGLPLFHPPSHPATQPGAAQVLIFTQQTVRPEARGSWKPEDVLLVISCSLSGQVSWTTLSPPSLVHCEC